MKTEDEKAREAAEAERKRAEEAARIADEEDAEETPPPPPPTPAPKMHGSKVTGAILDEVHQIKEFIGFEPGKKWRDSFSSFFEPKKPDVVDKEADCIMGPYCIFHDHSAKKAV